MKKNKISLVCMAGVFTALVFVFTSYLRIPTHKGYIHVGDGLIYLSACLLPCPYAIAVGAGGALLADCFTGYAMWAPCSVVIKSLTVLFFTNRRNSVLNLRNLLALFPVAVLCAGGYYLYEAVIYGNYVAPFAGIPASITQSVASTVVFVALGSIFDKMKIKLKVTGGNHK